MTTQFDEEWMQAEIDQAKQRSKKLLADILEKGQIELCGETTLRPGDPDFDSLVVGHINVIRNDLLRLLQRGSELYMPLEHALFKNHPLYKEGMVALREAIANWGAALDHMHEWAVAWQDAGGHDSDPRNYILDCWTASFPRSTPGGGTHTRCGTAKIWSTTRRPRRVIAEMTVRVIPVMTVPVMTVPVTRTDMIYDASLWNALGPPFFCLPAPQSTQNNEPAGS